MINLIFFLIIFIILMFILFYNKRYSVYIYNNENKVIRKFHNFETHEEALYVYNEIIKNNINCKHRYKIKISYF